MKDLDWLVQHRFEALTRHEYDWVFAFGDDVSIVAGCLWRLVEDGRIRVTNLDEGQWFGLPAPVDPVVEVSARLTDAVIDGVELCAGTLDLRIRFDTGHILELIPESSGYEAWNITTGDQQFIAIGGGELAVWGIGPSE